MGAIWENSIKFAIKSLNESNNLKLIKISEKLKFFSGKILNTLIDLTKCNSSKFDVICHGDLWNNNILIR